MSEVRNTFESPEEVRDYALPLLKEGVVVVDFVKKNGEARSMPCTLKAELLPVVEVKEDITPKVKKPNPDVLSVYATDVNGWRSFRLDSVTSIRFEV